MLLTDAEIDHTAGLLLLRESSAPLRVYGSEAVRHALTDGYPVLRILHRVLRRRVAHARARRPRSRSTAPRSRSSVRASAATRRATSPTPTSRRSGLVFRDRRGGGVLTYVPGLAHGSTTPCSPASRASDVVLVDGTFWRDDELARLGISDRTARQMGHVPLSGPEARWRRSRGSSDRA